MKEIKTGVGMSAEQRACDAEPKHDCFKRDRTVSVAQKGDPCWISLLDAQYH